MCPGRHEDSVLLDAATFLLRGPTGKRAPSKTSRGLLQHGNLAMQAQQARER